MVIIIAVVIVIVIFIYVLSKYNEFVKLRNLVSEAFSTMDVYLKKRWDLIPNIVETVKGYAKHESGILENITKLRTSSYDSMSDSEKIETNKQLSGEISKLIAVAENYPDLKASTNFSELTNQLSKIEEDIANSRKYYNAVVRDMNTKIEMFPANIIAKRFNFTKSKMFEVDQEERKNVKVEF